MLLSVIHPLAERMSFDDVCVLALTCRDTFAALGPAIRQALESTTLRSARRMRSVVIYRYVARRLGPLNAAKRCAELRDNTGLRAILPMLSADVNEYTAARAIAPADMLFAVNPRIFEKFRWIRALECRETPREELVLCARNALRNGTIDAARSITYEGQAAVRDVIYGRDKWISTLLAALGMLAFGAGVLALRSGVTANNRALIAAGVALSYASLGFLMIVGTVTLCFVSDYHDACR